MELSIPPRVTGRAFDRLREISSDGGGSFLRIAVEGGGCSGFQYEMKLEAAAAEGDIVIENDGTGVLIDPVSLPFLANAEIDFTNELIGARFVVNNPNATSSCGCGTSFSMQQQYRYVQRSGFILPEPISLLHQARS